MDLIKFLKSMFKKKKKDKMDLLVGENNLKTKEGKQYCSFHIFWHQEELIRVKLIQHYMLIIL